MHERTLERDGGELAGAAGPVQAARLGSQLAVVVTDRQPSTTDLVGSPVDVAVVGAEEVEGVELTDLETLVLEKLAPLDRDAREAILARLAGSTAWEGKTSFELSAALYRVREMLRERLPLCAVSEEQPVGLAVERILAVDDTSFWVNGWAHDEDGRGEVALVSPEGARVDITAAAFRHERPDVVQFYSGRGEGRTEKHGFAAHFEVSAPSALAAGWIAELHTFDGLQIEVRCPTVTHDARAVRSAILGELGSRGTIGGPLAEDHGRHALTRLQRRIVAESKLESVDTYGEPPTKPAVSVIVPLYKRLDFIEHQLLHFSADPELTGADLVYVLDSTEQREDLERLARELFALHRVPFRVVNLTAGAGYAAANEHGVAVARAKRLLLLNSDVIPDRPGWLGKMNEFHDSIEGIGALAPKLLYEDDSLQHAGLYFHRPPAAETWENAHCFKGMHRSFAPANVARPVPAVTGACMLLDRELYEQVGGLPLHYVQGDYEDSELCLRLAAAGRSNWYLPEVELYHLEGQSYTAGVRRVPSEYNMWLHTALFGERIEQTMAEFDPNATVAGAGG
jgi:GT2 family glycosyltransferase